MEVEKITDAHEIYFPKLGWRFTIDPTAFKIGGVSIAWYGILITAGLLLALLYCFPKMKRFGLDSDRTIDAVIGGVLGGIIGARLYYVAFNWSEYKADSFGATMKNIVKTREGGLAIYGGVIGALLVGLIICKIRKVKMLPMLDITVLGFLIGQGIGRWGNFVNQEAFGTNTSNFLGMTGGTIQSRILNESSFTDGLMHSHGMEISAYETVHPCFLYESLWCLLGFFLISWYSKRRKYDGQILLMYLSWYGAERFVVEGLRTDSLYIGSSDLRVSQLLSAVIFLASFILQIVLYAKYKRDPEAFTLYVSTEESHRLIEESRRKRMGMPAEDIRATMGEDDEDDDIGILDDDDYDDDFDDDEPSAPTILGDDDEDARSGDVPPADEEAEDVQDIAEDIAETVSTAAEEVTETAEDKAEDIAETVSAAAEEVTETAEEAVKESTEAVTDAAEDKYEDLAESYDEKLTGGSGKDSHNKKKRSR
ncbi:MAG: prolipoprotein diacylglyceryl transferase [Ruminococcus sp.]|nr:prolipoprotein diacylglyceryl transferase [Ruminococcus sp.]